MGTPWCSTGGGSSHRRNGQNKRSTKAREIVKFRGQKESEMEGDMRAIIASYALMGRRPEMSRSSLLGIGVTFLMAL